MKTTCATCGTTIDVKPSRLITSGNYCSKTCRGVGMRGTNNPNYGKGLYGASNGMYGRNHTQSAKDAVSRANLGSIRPRGHEHYAWKGGLKNLNQHLRDHPRMKRLIQDVFERDDYTCYITGIRGGVLNAHHIIPLRVLLHAYHITTIEDAESCPEIWDANNLVTVSYAGHRRLHGLVKHV